MNFFTIKITDKEILIAIWDGLNLIKFKRYQKDYAKKITLIARILKIEINNIIYHDSTGQYDNYFSGAIKVKLDRKPIQNQQYKNLKHQLYFALIDAIKNNQIQVLDKNFPQNEFIQEKQYLEINKLSENNKLEIISRKKIIDQLGRDIDLIDLLSYRFFAKLKGIG